MVEGALLIVVSVVKSRSASQIGSEGPKPCCNCNIKMDEYMAELARRFAASFISVQMHTSFNTEYRKLKDQRPGELWFSLARAATEAIAAHGQPTEAFFNAEIKGPPQ